MCGCRVEEPGDGMRVLIYKRTHPGDPNADGVFGCEDCMGAVRRRRFDAVIGVGGIGPEAQSFRIDRRLNWVGVGAHSTSIPVGLRGPLVTFDRFLLLEDQGPDLQSIAPTLARYMYATHRRVVMPEGLSPTLQREIQKILSLAVPARNRSSRQVPRTRQRGCHPRPCAPARDCHTKSAGKKGGLEVRQVPNPSCGSKRFRSAV